MSNAFYIHVLQAVSAVIFLLLVGFICEMLLVRHVKDKKKSIKLRVFLRYMLVFCFCFIMAKIWVEGFGYLLTFIGVIAAALTITQKEYLMNFFGWLIIMWRDLFVEGDYVEIAKYSGFVLKIRPLYFALEEACSKWGEKTGKIVNIPNSFIATNPVIHSRLENLFVSYTIEFIFTMETPFGAIQDLSHSIEKTFAKFMQSRQLTWSTVQKEQYRLLGRKAKPEMFFELHQTPPSGIRLTIKFFSLKKDLHVIEENVLAFVMEAIEDNSALNLATVR